MKKLRKMGYVLFKTVRVPFWTLLLFFLVSGGMGEDNAPLPEGLPNGRYDLKASGDYSENFSGIVDYEIFMEKAVSGKSYATLKLNFRHWRNPDKNAFEFIISKPSTEIKIMPGSYGIATSINGFLNCFDGAFGYANGKELGETPFFSRKGRITIQQMGPFGLKGTIAVYLSNPAGKTIYISGGFVAPKKGIER